MTEPDFSKSMKNFIDAVHHQSRMTHSSVVLVSAAILDGELERALRKAMRPLPRKLYERLFESLGGPLTTFASKILMARALGVLTVEIYEELEKIKCIRNEFAHSAKVLNFESEEIAPMFLALRKRETTKTKRPEVFVDCVQVIEEFLVAFVAQGDGLDKISA